MSNQMQIDRGDIETLLDALDAYEKEAGADSSVGAILGGLMMKRGDASESDVKKFITEQHEKGRAETAARRERAIMLKAKLLIWRDRMEAGDFSDSALR